MKFAKNTFPEGFEFDPYMGEGVGAVRLKVSGIKVFDEVDEGMGSKLAWSLVEPELYKRGQELLQACNTELSKMETHLERVLETAELEQVRSLTLAIVSLHRVARYVRENAEVLDASA